MRAKELSISKDSNDDYIVSFRLCNKNDFNKLQKFLNIDFFELTVKKIRKKRSLNANAYCWELCNNIAIALNSTKEEIYRHAIRQVGVLRQVPIHSDDVEALLRHFSGQGIGNYAEVIKDAKTDGYVIVCLYFGSSSYDTKEMSRLIQYLVEEAKELEIDTISSKEVERLLQYTKG